MTTRKWEAYRPVFEVLDQALAKNIQLTFRNRAACTTWLHQAYKARVTDRELAKKSTRPGDADYGRSVYDDLQFHRDGDFRLHIGKGIVDRHFVLTVMGDFEIEELGPSGEPPAGGSPTEIKSRKEKERC